MAAGRGAHPSPISLAVASSILAVLLCIFFTGAIALNYALMVHYIHTLQAQQVKQGIVTCKHIKEVAEAGKGAALYQPGNPKSFDVRLAQDWPRLYLTSGCEKYAGPL